MKSLSAIFLLRKIIEKPSRGDQEPFSESKGLHSSLLNVKKLFSCHGVKCGWNSQYPVNVKRGLQTADWGKIHTYGKCRLQTF